MHKVYQLASAACVFSVPLCGQQQTSVWTDCLYPIGVTSCDGWSFASETCLLHFPWILGQAATHCLVFPCLNRCLNDTSIVCFPVEEPFWHPPVPSILMALSERRLWHRNIFNVSSELLAVLVTPYSAVFFWCLNMNFHSYFIHTSSGISITNLYM